MDLNEETFNTHANAASSMEEDVVPDQLQYNTRISDSTQHNHNAGYVKLVPNADCVASSFDFEMS